MNALESEKIEQALDAGLKLARTAHYHRGAGAGAIAAILALTFAGVIVWWAALAIAAAAIISGEIAERRERARQRRIGVEDA